MIRFSPAVMVVGVLSVSALPALADVPIFIDNDTGRGAWITVYGGPMNDILYSTCIAPHRSWSYRFPKGWGVPNRVRAEMTTQANCHHPKLADFSRRVGNTLGASIRESGGKFTW